MWPGASFPIFVQGLNYPREIEHIFLIDFPLVDNDFPNIETIDCHLLRTYRNIGLATPSAACP